MRERVVESPGARDAGRAAEGAAGRALEPGEERVAGRSMDGVAEPSPGDPLARYARHLRIPEIGEAGQRRLLRSRVVLVGAGGLGSSAALYLAAAGVGNLGIVDGDVVDCSNLQRQLLHKTRNIGLPKTQSAREMLFDVNPDVRVDTWQVRLTKENAEEILRNFDVVIDASDNFQTRYLVNDVCLKLGAPNIYASVFRLEGQASVFLPGQQGPCYRCLYPTPPPSSLSPSSQEVGVLGVLPGILGLLQATEAIKLLLGIGRTLSGRLLTFDALELEFREFAIPRYPDCLACGAGGDVDRLLAEWGYETEQGV